jgi:hypothetical protein
MRQLLPIDRPEPEIQGCLFMPGVEIDDTAT